MIKRPSRKKLKKKWESEFGKIPKGFELHHKKPIWEGGTDDLENLVAVTFEEHKMIHYERYLQNNDIRDLLASKIGLSNDQIRIESAKLGGKKGGLKQFELKIGIHAQTKEERLKFASMGGKKGAFTNKLIQSELGKKGGKNNQGFVWINDGIKNYKYTRKQQANLSVNEFIQKNPEYRLGRCLELETCCYCKKKLSVLHIGRYHNQNCRNKS